MGDREQPGRASASKSGRDDTTLVELTAAAARGDERAFESLHRRVGAGLRRLLMKRSGARVEIVDDLMQTTWTSVWNALRSGRYDPERAAITTFVYAVGNNAWLTHLRQFSREQGSTVAGEDGSIAQIDSHDDAMGQAEAIEAVRACLRDPEVAGLSDLERSVLRSIAAGETDRGLARRLGISCSTVNVRKHAGLVKIREHLERRGLDESRPGAEPTVSPTASIRGPVQQVRPSVAGGAA